MTSFCPLLTEQQLDGLCGARPHNLQQFKFRPLLVVNAAGGERLLQAVLDIVSLEPLSHEGQ